MNAPRHLSRVLREILSCAGAGLDDDVLVDERSTLNSFAEHLIRKAPEQIRPSAWDDLDCLVEGIGEALDEPHKSTVEGIWTGAYTGSPKADPRAPPQDNQDEIHYALEQSERRRR